MKNASISEMKRGLRIHAIAFALGMPILLAINLLIGAPYWALWGVLPGWGSGLLIHWWAVGRHAAKAGTHDAQRGARA